MVWGYGRSGYARWRSREALESRDATVILHESVEVLFEQGPLSAYGYLAQHRLRYLGPAFATKYLYFCGKDRLANNALILDRNVAEWLTRHTEVRLNPVPWSKRTYSEYLNTLGEWAGALAVGPDAVESCIFRDAVAGTSGQWDEEM
jgi:thermostable 8-oxoguanine DNA glycosylase